MPPNATSVDDFSGIGPALVGDSAWVYGSSDPDSIVFVGIWSDVGWIKPDGWIGPLNVVGPDPEFPDFRLRLYYLRAPDDAGYTFTTDDAADHIFAVQRCVVHFDGPTNSVLVDWDNALPWGDNTFVPGDVGSITDSPSSDDSPTGWAAANGPVGHDSVGLFFSGYAVSFTDNTYTAPTVDVDAGPVNPSHSFEDPPGSESPSTGFNATAPGGAYTQMISTYLSYVLLPDGVGIAADDYRTEWSSAFAGAGPAREHISLLAVIRLIDEGPPPGSPVIGIECGPNHLDLGPDFDAFGDEGEWGSIAPGGYDSLTLRITEAVYRANIEALSFGASVVVNLPADDPHDPGAESWAGLLRRPVPDGDGFVTLEAVGYKELLTERDDPLLFSTWDPSAWQLAEQAPWTFTNAESIQATIEGREVVFGVDTGTEVAGGDIARMGNEALGHVIRSVGGSVVSSITTVNYELTLRSIHAPDEPGTEVVEETWTPSMVPVDFDVAFSSEQGAAVFALERVDGGTVDAKRLRVRLSNVHARDIADDDDFTISDGIIALFERAGIAPDEVTATPKKLGPLWWTSGNWEDLASYFGTARGWHWSVWGRNGSGDPIGRFGPFAGVGLPPNWFVNAYGDDATCRANLVLLEDVYTHVDVSYQLAGDDTVRHYRVPVDLDEISACADGRIRVFRIDVRDPQPDDTIPIRIAEDTAEELASEDFGGEVVLTTAEDADVGGSVHNAALIRATQSIYLRDFENPDGTFGRKFKIYEARFDQMTGFTTLRIGRIPVGLARSLWDDERRAA